MFKALMIFLYCFFAFEQRDNLWANDKHWAFRPLIKPEVPDCGESAWPRNEVDAFILRKLGERGLEPSPRADPRTLWRRMSYALVGLPNLGQSTEVAFEDEIERLLASEHYGEKWARHWMDVARYADSNGLDENLAFAHAWRYRDYLIDAFNDDLPFDQFLLEQVAGDLLGQGKPLEESNRLKVATGFLALGPKLLAEPDPIKMEMDMIDEQLDVIGQAFLGLTIGCARCHDHMSDPISTAEYYAMAGIFKSTKTMESVHRPTKWFEHHLSPPSARAFADKYERLIEAQKKLIEAFKDKANYELLAKGKFRKIPKTPSLHYTESTQKELSVMEDRLLDLEKNRPELEFCHGVSEGNATDLRVFLRGDSDTLGEVQKRGFLGIFQAEQNRVIENQMGSGRLQFGRWMVEECKPLVARVIVNRIWRWHFGRGLVATPDNFGELGARPTHPKLLDWLACKFLENNWSIKSLHRLIITSATWQTSSLKSPSMSKVDPENLLYAGFPSRRLEVEIIRDSLLALSGELDTAVGGKVFYPENRKHVFNVTSVDETSYDLNRRSIYLPVVRNHVYDFFQLFDYPDPKIVQGDRKTLSTNQQALFLMNSQMIQDKAMKIAKHEFDQNLPRQVSKFYQKVFLRNPGPEERREGERFLDEFPSPRDPYHARASFVQAMLSSDEFLYLR